MTTMNCDFEGIDNDLLISDPSPLNGILPRATYTKVTMREPLDGFTRSQYGNYTQHHLESASEERNSSRLNRIRTPDGPTRKRVQKFLPPSRLSDKEVPVSIGSGS